MCHHSFNPQKNHSGQIACIYHCSISTINNFFISVKYQERFYSIKKQIIEKRITVFVTRIAGFVPSRMSEN